MDTLAKPRWVIRETVTQFIVNGYTKHPHPIIHTPECADVREAMSGLYEMIPDVLDRYVPTAHPLVPRVDLLAIMKDDPEARVGWCQHCVVRRDWPA